MRDARELLIVVGCALTLGTMPAFAQAPPGGGPPPPGAPGGPPPIGPPPGGAPGAGGPASANPLPGLTADESGRFAVGLAQFVRPETVGGGLGPVFNEVSCVTCHTAPGAGGGSGRQVTHFARVVAGLFDPLTEEGGSVIQSRGIGAVTTATGSYEFIEESVPADANVTARHVTPPLHGLGLIDAVPDETLLALASAQANDPDRIGGRPNMVVDATTGRLVVGRFGWKAQVPTLLQFSGDAYVNEMGITNPAFPSENCPQGDCRLLDFNPEPGLNDDGSRVAAVTDFVTLLAAPARGPVTAETEEGEAVFHAIGCSSCHVASLTTGPHAVAALDRVTFAPWSDFLLHDMGDLGDGIEQGIASGSEMRTAPLWGLGQRPRYLHDAHATTLEEAITLHDGQARAARDRFVELDASSASRLLAFLESL